MKNSDKTLTEFDSSPTNFNQAKETFTERTITPESFRQQKKGGSYCLPRLPSRQKESNPDNMINEEPIRVVYTPMFMMCAG